PSSSSSSDGFARGTDLSGWWYYRSSRCEADELRAGALEMAKLPLLKVPTVDYGADEPQMVAYRADGERRAMELGNRGPLVLDEEGKPRAAILEAYRRCGFYVFEGLLQQDELDDIERDVAAMLARAPITKDAPLDREGRPALGVDCKAPTLSWVKPLS